MLIGRRRRGCEGIPVVTVARGVGPRICGDGEDSFRRRTARCPAPESLSRGIHPALSFRPLVGDGLQERPEVGPAAHRVQIRIDAEVLPSDGVVEVGGAGQVGQQGDGAGGPTFLAVGVGRLGPGQGEDAGGVVPGVGPPGRPGEVPGSTARGRPRRGPVRRGRRARGIPASGPGTTAPRATPSSGCRGRLPPPPGRACAASRRPRRPARACGTPARETQGSASAGRCTCRPSAGRRAGLRGAPGRPASGRPTRPTGRPSGRRGRRRPRVGSSPRPAWPRSARPPAPTAGPAPQAP